MVQDAESGVEGDEGDEAVEASGGRDMKEPLPSL
jgi:hypothetical protein